MHAARLISTDRAHILLNFFSPNPHTKTVGNVETDATSNFTHICGRLTITNKRQNAFFRYSCNTGMAETQNRTCPVPTQFRVDVLGIN